LPGRVAASGQAVLVHNLADDPSPAHAVVLERMRQKWQARRERAK